MANGMVGDSLMGVIKNAALPFIMERKHRARVIFAVMAGRVFA